MATINIGGHEDDMFYRYKMPKLEIKIDGKGRSMNIILVNLCAIAKALHRSPMYIIKFFGYELSTAVHVDAKENRYIIRGAHDYGILQNILDKFIEKFVICSNCNIPETEFVLCKRKNIEVHKVCAVCGYQGQDKMQLQKLTAYIAKNLRDNTSDNENTTTIDKQSNVIVQDDDDDDLLPTNQLIVLIEQLKNENQLNDMDAIQEIILNAEQLNLTDECPLIIATCIFTENILTEIAKYQSLLQQSCKNNIKGQKSLLHSLEILIHDHEQIRARVFNKRTITEILHTFYQKDIIEEDTFIQWYQKPSKHFADKTISREIRQISEAFIQWLSQPDASDDDDDSDDKTPELKIAEDHITNEHIDRTTVVDNTIEHV